MYRGVCARSDPHRSGPAGASPRPPPCRRQHGSVAGGLVPSRPDRTTRWQRRSHGPPRDPPRRGLQIDSATPPRSARSGENAFDPVALHQADTETWHRGTWATEGRISNFGFAGRKSGSGSCSYHENSSRISAKAGPFFSLARPPVARNIAAAAPLSAPHSVELPATPPSPYTIMLVGMAGEGAPTS